MFYTFNKGETLYAKTLETLKKDPAMKFYSNFCRLTTEPMKSADSMVEEMIGAHLFLEEDIAINTIDCVTDLPVTDSVGDWHWQVWMIDWEKSARASCHSAPSMEIE